MNIIEKLALIIIFISVVKLIGMFAFKKFFNEFVKSYIQSIGKNPWMYFIVYYSLSIIVLSIILMAVAANLISEWIKKYKWIAWVGLLAILLVAVDLIYTDLKLIL